ncbi:histidine phosphatase superfamily [Xylaria palmicola]|nr:histidine phosphatase superfamily [Xylaria palmicola]
MPPVIDVIRHAQSTHDANGNAFARDPALTAEGESQAFRLGRSFGYMRCVSHIVASPLRCAVRTAVVAFEEMLLEGKRVILLPELQETGVHPCDTGQPPEALRTAFGPQIDTSLLDRNWYYKGQGSPYVPDVALVEARAREARVFLRGLAQTGPADAHIVVVGHGAFLHFLTGDYAGLSGEEGEEGEGGGAAPPTAYGNAAMRSFRFVDLYGTDREAAMVETLESSRRSQLPRFVELREDEQRRLRSYAVARVERQKAEFERMTRPSRPQVRTHVF